MIVIFFSYFHKVNHICINGRIIKDNLEATAIGDRGSAYGNGLFETMKLINGKIVLAQYHFERLMAGLDVLQLQLPSDCNRSALVEKILELCILNNCRELARVRLTVTKDNYKKHSITNAQYTIECWPLDERCNFLNEKGLVLDIYPEEKKNTGMISNLKTTNSVLYPAAAAFAKEKGLDDSVILNRDNGIADSTIANIFILRENMIFTPSLNAGCVNGVMRRYLLEKIGEIGSYQLEQKKLTVHDLETADEIFLTNAIRGIRWVARFREKEFQGVVAEELHETIITKLYSKLN